jgi:hypothetical protein
MAYRNEKIGRRGMLAAAGSWAVLDSSRKLDAATGARPEIAPALAQYTMVDGGGSVQDYIDHLRSSSGGEMVGFSHVANYAGDSVGRRLAQEIWVTDSPYNADPTGRVDAAAAFQAALDALESRGGGTLRGKGRFKIGASLKWPAEPSVVNFRGEGYAATTLIQGTADTPIIRKISGVSRIVGAELTGFTVQAHPASTKAKSANILINIAGFDSSTIRVAYVSDPAATSSVGCAYAVISGHANNGVCYRNSIFLKMHQTAGPKKGVWLHNGGAGNSLANANCNEVSIWAYALSNLGEAIDGGDTTQMVVKFSLLEECPGAIGVTAGNFTVTRNNWFEMVAVAIRFAVTSDTVANNCVSISDQFSGTNKIVIHSSVTAPPRFNDPLLGETAFENQGGALSTNYVVPTVAKVQPVIPSISWALVGARTTPDAAASRLLVDHHGITTTMATYTAKPVGRGRSILVVTPPAGFEIMNATIGIEEIGVGVRPVALSSDPAGTHYVVYWPNTNPHQVNVRVTMRAV